MRAQLEERIESILTILASRDRLPEYRALKLKKVLPQLERAIEKIEEGTYGFCDDCPEPIPAERLTAAPGATRCLPCQQISEKN
jgi:phage/conjugal plasmid C-4 type zinc finger TraR family protein